MTPSPEDSTATDDAADVIIDEPKPEAEMLESTFSSKLKRIPTKLWAIGAISLAIVALGTVILLTFVGSLRTTPDLVGLPQVEAEALLKSQELLAGPQMHNDILTVPASHRLVVSQEQTAGDTVRKGDVLRFTVEAEKLSMPDFTDMTWYQFTKENKDLFLHATSQLEVVKPRYVITKQTPAAGTSSHYGAKITFELSIPQVEMPDLVGKKPAEATAILDETGLDYSVLTSDYGVVKSQSVPAKSKVDVNSVIELELGLLVPNVTGKSRDEASELLEEAGITNSKFEGPYTAPIASQSPAPGTIISLEEAVMLVAPKHSKTIRVESNGSSGSVTWGLSSIKQETDASFPWEYTTEHDTKPERSINVFAQTLDGTSITCKLIIDGEVVIEETSTGPYAVVSCSNF